MASRKEQREQARREREQREAEEQAKQRRKRRLWQIGGGVALVAAVIIIAVVIASSGGDQKVDKQETQTTQNRFAGIAQNGLTLGNPEAKVTLYEFADLQCPFCRQYTTGPFHQLVEKYVRTGKVKMVWRNLTFLGPDSVTAARAAIAAGQQNKLWNFIDLFYQNQGAENSGYVTDKFIEDIAKGAGANPTKLTTDSTAPIIEQQLGEAQTQATQFKIDSTPSFLIQIGKGQPEKLDYSALEFSAFQKPLDDALKKAGGGT